MEGEMHIQVAGRFARVLNGLDCGLLRQPDRLWITAVTALSAALIYSSIGQQGYWFDEIFSIHETRDWQSVRQNLEGFGGNRIVYNILLHFWIQAGEGETWARTLSALFALGSIPVAYALFKRLTHQHGAILSTVLFALNPFFLTYAQEVRNYSLLLFLSALCGLAFVGAVQTLSSRYWALYALSGILAAGTHPFAVFLPLGLGVSMCFLPSPRPWKRFILTSGMVLLTPVLLRLVFGSPNMDQLSWISLPSWNNVIHFFKVFAGGTRQMAVVHLALSFWAILPSTRFHAPGVATSWARSVPAFWLAGPLVLALAFSWAVQPMFIPRYLIFCLPALSLLTGIGVSRIRHRGVRLVVLLLVLISFVHALDKWPRGKEQWREASQTLLDVAREGDAILYYPRYIFKPLTFYMESLQAAEQGAIGPELRSITGMGNHVPDLELLRSLSQQHARLWLVIRDENFDGRREQIGRAIEELGRSHVRGDTFIYRGIRIYPFTRLP
jgi:mannosyltransferase